MGVANNEEEVEGDSPSIILYDSRHKAVASRVMTSKSVTKGGPNDWVPREMVKQLEEWGVRKPKTDASE